MTATKSAEKVSITAHYEARLAELTIEIEAVTSQIKDRRHYDYSESTGEQDDDRTEIGTGGVLVENQYGLEKQMKKIEEEIESLKCEIENRQEVIEDLTERGIDAKSVHAELGKLTKKHKSLTAKLEKTKKNLTDLSETMESLWEERETLEEQRHVVNNQLKASKLLAQVGVDDAFLVPSSDAIACHESVRHRLIWKAQLDDLAALSTVKLSFSLSRGTDCDDLTWIGHRGNSFSFTISGEERRFVVGLSPKALNWVSNCITGEAFPFTESVSHTDEVKDLNLVFICAETKQLVISECLEEQLAEYEEETERRYSDWYKRHENITIRTRVDCFHELNNQNGLQLLSASLASSLKDTCEDANGTLNLDEPTENLLLEQCRQWLLEATTTEPLFPVSDQNLTSTETFARIKDEWQRFKNAPWSWGITGTAASLKHLVENGERVRFWCNAHESHYGFRVRTRDHSWIVGNIFIDEQYAEDSTVIEVCASEHSRDGVAVISFLRVGRMCLKAWETRN
jgi:hypothetical protein